MPPATRKDATAEDLNKLYWTSQATVSEIMRDNEATRSRLYGAVQPLETDAECPKCGGTLAFRNRRDRSGGTAWCASCGTETSILESSGESDGDVDTGSGNGQDPSTSPMGRIVPGRKAALLGGAAAVGIAIGAAAAKVIKD